MELAVHSYQQTAARESRDQLVLDNLEFVRHVLARIAAELPPGVDRENLESAGVLGLVEAARQFDPDRGVNFRAYAYNRIRGAIYDELRRNCPLPQMMLQKLARIREAQRTLRHPVTLDAVAAFTGLSLEEVDECLEAMRLTRTDSWDDEAADHPAASDDDVSASLERQEQLRLLADAIEALPERERLITTLYYLEDMRLKEIGAVVGLSESRVSRLLARAEFRLKEAVNRSGRTSETRD